MSKIQKRKKTVKGMTLIECIISMLVLAVLGWWLLQSCFHPINFHS